MRPLLLSFILMMVIQLLSINGWTNKNGPTSLKKSLEVYFSDNIPHSLVKDFIETRFQIEEEGKKIVQGAVYKYVSEGLNIGQTSELFYTLGEMINKKVADLRKKLKPDEIYQIRFGVARAKGPIDDDFQSGQIGLGESERYDHIFIPSTHKIPEMNVDWENTEGERFAKHTYNSIIEVIKSENDYFKPDALMKVPHYHGYPIDEKTGQSKKVLSCTPEEAMRIMKQSYSKHPPYFLGLFSVIEITKDNASMKMQWVLGLRPYEVNDLNQTSDPLFVTKLSIPHPQIEENRDLGPVALVDINLDTALFKNKNQMVIPIHIQFGSFGGYEELSGQAKTGSRSFMQRLLDGIFRNGIRISDTVPRLEGNVINAPSVSMDINIHSLEFELRPNKIAESIPQIKEIKLEDVIQLEGLSDSIFDRFFLGILSLKTNLDTSVIKTQNKKYDFIRLKKSQLTLSPGFGNYKRILALQGSLGGAEERFTGSINDTIDENLNHLLTSVEGKNIINTILPNFFNP